MREQLRDIQSAVDKINEVCGSLTNYIAVDAEVKKAFADNDQDRLNEIILPVYARWQDNYSINQLQLVSSHGKRVWDVNTLLDANTDLKYRRIIHHSIEQKQRLTVIESFEGKNSIVSTVPFFVADKYIGFCELDLSLHLSLREHLDKMASLENYAVYELQGIESRLLWQKKPPRVELNTDDIRKAQKGTPFYRSSGDKNITLIVVPLVDMDNITVAYIQGEISRQAFIKARNYNYVLLGLLISFIFIVSFYIYQSPIRINCRKK
ncbi:Uncharacterized [Syntrophomonas zehnderi OL-4]|uniref:Uncharacterized n=1 Tax=Syntrophomonas zehnderi OL-4 TaxID=690567 RepID=A0A0E4C918_9FIRM|nr:cache domain-containing protein [Syntrophomonas zehnderi]CFX82054.1 Uncharacterized [Syntrophomonas zehnderi OL-4]